MELNYQKNLLNLYKGLLLDDVIPWWIKYGIDSTGAINTCIENDGSLISKDRWLWSQWRAVWVFSKLYNTIEKRKDWLDIAMGIYRFITNTGALENNHWPTLLDENGKILKGYESIYVDGFAIYGLSELYKATRDKEIYQLAKNTFEATIKDLKKNTPPPAWPYPIDDGVVAHGISMIFSIAYHELALASKKTKYESAALHHQHQIMDVFYRKDRNVILEFMNKDFTELKNNKGKVCVPGHAIESMWFQIHIAYSNNDKATINKAIQQIKRSLELGWDQEYGGLLLAIDVEGNENVAWPHHNTKLWWPHTEALYATLLAYQFCGESWCLEWHERVREWSFNHFPSKFGEWKQKLNRAGKEIKETLVLPVKDPFHLPRALIYNTLALENKNF